MLASLSLNPRFWTLRYCFVAAALCIFLAPIAFRMIGLGPIAMADETIYSAAARVYPLSDAQVPNYLYLAVYGLTSHCGSAFYACAKLINLFFFLAAVPCIYLVATHFCGRAVSALVAAMSGFLPIATYTTYFIPESMYFFGFWLYVMAMVNVTNQPKTARVLGAASVIGICGLIKPHAAFLLIPSLIFLRFFVKLTYRKLGAFILVVLLVRFIIPFLLIGPNALDLFGSIYRDMASMRTPKAPLSYLPQIMHVLQGHCLFLLISFGLPMLNLLSVRREREPVRQFAALIMLLLVTLISVSVIFTAVAAGLTEHETVNRLHTRYYSFLYPLFLIFVAIQKKHLEIQWIRGVLVLATAALFWESLSQYPLPYTPLHTDSPAAFGLVESGFLRIIATITLVTLLVAVFRPNIARLFFLFFLFPFQIVVAHSNLLPTLNAFATPTTAHKAALVTSNFLTMEMSDSLLIVGDVDVDVYRAGFFLGSAALYVGLEPDEEMMAGQEWLLALSSNGYQISDQWSEVLSGEGFTLLKRIGPPELIFSNSGLLNWLGAVRRHSGIDIDPGNDFGQWTIGETARIEFVIGLPANFGVELAASAFQSNLDEEFTLSVGDSHQRFLLSENARTICIGDFHNPQQKHEIVLQIPNPRAPVSLGLNNDVRRLGAFIEKLTVVPSCH